MKMIVNRNTSMGNILKRFSSHPFAMIVLLLTLGCSTVTTGCNKSSGLKDKDSESETSSSTFDDNISDTDDNISDTDDTSTSDDTSTMDSNYDTSQDAVNIKSMRFVNNSDFTVYLNGRVPSLLFSCEAQNETEFFECRFFPYECKLNCSDIELNDSCCIQCELPTPAVVEIPAGALMEKPWDGLLYFLNDSSCKDECECLDSMVPPHGEYTVSVKVYSSYTCNDSDCNADSEGVINDAIVSDIPVIQDLKFSIPTNVDILEIIYEP